MPQWSRRHHRCILCLDTSFKHIAYGLCNSCYQKLYKSDPEINARIESQKSDWRQSNLEYVLAKAKQDREQRHYDGIRDEILKRDNYQCVDCGSTDQLAVHHKDGNGRGKDNPNNDPSNLETLCRACHMKAHRQELYAARKANGWYRPKIGKYKSRFQA